VLGVAGMIWDDDITNVIVISIDHPIDHPINNNRYYIDITGIMSLFPLRMWPIYRWFTWVYLLKMVIFHGYVK
jgi:hypothetical protein